MSAVDTEHTNLIDMRALLFVAALALLNSSVTAQSGALQGTVLGEIDGTLEPLPGANLFWLDTEVGASTDAEGRFILDRPNNAKFLVVAYLGFRSDTLKIEKNRTQVQITMVSADVRLNEVTVREKVVSTSVKYLDVNLTENISERELFKAACCDLSESFETNPSVDAGFTDAVTGTRQIRMLGLDGPYSTYTRGNIKAMDGLASVYGLALIPGMWIKSIQLTKGTGSVVNGYSSVTGQINYELRSSADEEHRFVNGYVNGAGRLEENVVWNEKIGEYWGTTFLLHGRRQLLEIDRNGDDFLDTPFGNQLFLQNTWRRFKAEGLRTQFGVKYSYIDQWSGQEDFIGSDASLGLWGYTNESHRAEVWAKGGYVINAEKRQSFGFQGAANYHDIRSEFGGVNVTTNTWRGTEQSAYFNGIYETELGHPDHSLKAGASFVYHDQSETFNDDVFERSERVPGAFAEYTLADPERFSVVLGFRADQHNLYGLNLTPRLHTRLAVNENLVLRASAGKAYRTPNMIADRMGLLASNRDWVLAASDSDLPYGLQQEEAWNFGFSASHDFEWDYRPASLRVDYYYTDFQNQIVTDLYASAREVRLYNLNERSFSHSFQVQLDYEVVRRVDVRLAYRYLDVKSTFGGDLRGVPFIETHKAFTNIAWQSRNYWKADLTVQWHGAASLPYTGDNGASYRIAPQAPDFVTANLQVSKEWPTTGWEAYLGVENFTNFKMTRPIVSAENPFAEEFDASMVWGPILGRMYYAGFRFRLLKADG